MNEENNLAKIAFSIMIILLLGLPAFTKDSISLPAPLKKGGNSLLYALKMRKSSREYSPRPLSMKTLSTLLWATGGINRSLSKKKTVPSAMNKQFVDIYLATKDGIYFYNPQMLKLLLIKKGDYRGNTGKQGFVKTAAVNIIFVADLSRSTFLMGKDGPIYAAVEAGAMSQNLYLYCASTGLNTVVRAWIDTENLHKIMGLSNKQKILLSQSVGYPR